MPPTPPPALDFAHDALFLDFDGTLVDIAATPEAVIVPDTIVASLRTLSERLDGRLAIVSGRALDVLDAFGLTGLAAAGSHGAEWRLADGERHCEPPPPGLAQARERFAALADQWDGVLFEDKPLGAALHYRLARDDDAKRACHALARELAARWDLHVQDGHAMVELRGAGIDKGSAIALLLEREPFRGHRPVFFGDDVTDEPGFAAVREAGGHGVLIGAARQSAAQYGLPGPELVRQYLTDALRI